MTIKQLPPTAPEGFDQEAWTAIRTLIATVNQIQPGTGEANTSSNSGGGQGLALAKAGVDLPFKSLLATAPITLSSQAETLTHGLDINSLTTLAPSPASSFYVWQRTSDGAFFKADAT